MGLGGKLIILVVLREKGLVEDVFESEVEDFVDEAAKKSGFGGGKESG